MSLPTTEPGSFAKSAFRTEPFDTVWVNDGISANAITLPVLTLVQNRVDDIYRGRGPAGQYVRLVCDRPTGFNACDWNRTIKVNSQGKWSFGNYWDISGNKGMYLRWRRGDDIISTTSVSPFLQLTIGSPKVSGATRNGASFAVVVKKANTVDMRGSASGIASTATGEFNGKLRNQSGNLVNVRVGDFVTSDVAPDVAWIVHDIPASANSSTGHITGFCDDARSYIVLVYHGGVLVDSDEMYTEMSGNFDIDYLTFQAGDQIQVSCRIREHRLGGQVDHR